MTRRGEGDPATHERYLRNREKQREYYERNLERRREYGREYNRRLRAERPELDREYRARYRAEGDARTRARQLLRGERIMNQVSHHRGMAKLKEWMGDPRPEGLTLSLINPDSPNAYWGRVAGTKGGQPYRLSTSPSDYVWETQGDNNRRKAPAGRAPP